MGKPRQARNRALPPNLYINAAGYYYYRNPANKKVRGVGRDKPKAIQEARAANAILESSRRSSLADWVSGKQDYCLTDWLPIYRELWIAAKSPAASTVRMFDYYLGMISNADFAARQLRDITTAHIATYLAAATETNGAGMATNLRARLSDLFRMAETQGLVDINRNPATATYTPGWKVKRARLTLEQFHQVHAQAPTWLQRAMYLALLTGQRREDIANMQFSDCKEGYLHVIQGKSQGQVRLKLDTRIRLDAVNKSIQDVVSDCRDLIISRHMIHHVAKRGHVTPGDKLTPVAITGAFHDARTRAGLVAEEGRTLPTFHEIRSLAERLYKEQYGAEFAQAILGHKQAKTTAKYDDLRGMGWQEVAAR